jgi:methylmalonyl-CoA/ethylmalonyl-CoA epimerase
MIARVDHIALAVRDYDSAARFFCEILGAIPGSCAEVKDRKYFWRNFVLGDLTRLEILSPTGEGSFLDGFLNKRAGGFHHITLETPDLEAMIRVLEENGIPYFGRNEYPGGVWKEIFIHPKDAFGALIQIAEFRPNDWIADEAKLSEDRKWEIEKTPHGGSISFSHPGGGKVKLDFSREELQRLSDAIRNALTSPA